MGAMHAEHTAPMVCGAECGVHDSVEPRNQQSSSTVSDFPMMTCNMCRQKLLDRARGAADHGDTGVVSAVRRLVPSKNSLFKHLRDENVATGGSAGRGA